jgi:hypothetical protein
MFSSALTLGSIFDQRRLEHNPHDTPTVQQTLGTPACRTNSRSRRLKLRRPPGGYSWPSQFDPAHKYLLGREVPADRGRTNRRRQPRGCRQNRSSSLAHHTAARLSTASGSSSLLLGRLHLDGRAGGLTSCSPRRKTSSMASSSSIGTEGRRRALP